MIAAPLRRPAATPALTALICLTLAAVTGCSEQSAPAPKAASTALSPNPAQPTAPPTERKAAEPVHMKIASIGVDSTLMGLGLNQDGTVEVPPSDQGMTAGWYKGASIPGEPGASVIIGHNETKSGKGVFYDLKKLRKGAEISVRNATGTTATFTVTRMEAVKKKAFPTQKVYGPTNSRELRLVTCDGAYDAAGHTVDNLIVYATLS
ncbi:class F sortase [Streptomyces albipurpureus]|uniref:Class F sortase n=1 Tax=Streptomyces albipurpureus TaxID=2897419 RepID=A0ABT0UV30_9ACTN|nr:class F sortase [Streptomyces sp. CWNU-1]MCM2392252.1 class F sortase [Streptomyces sp. CWNU-1]